MRAMKRTVSILLSLLMIVGMATVFGVSTASAAETNTVTYTSNIGASGTIDYVPGTTETVTVNYTMTNAQNIINLEGVVTFDKTVLAVQSATSDLDGAMINTTKTDGRLPIVYSNVNGEALANDKLISVVFSVIGSGDTTVNFNVENLTATTTPGTASNNDVRLIEDGVVADNPTFTAQATAAVYPEAAPGVDPAIFYQSVTLALEGKIGMQYYIYEAPQGYTDKSKLSVQMEGPNEEENKTLAYSNLTFGKRKGERVAKIVYNLKSYMMSQPVNVKFIYDGEVVATSSLSIRDWTDANLATYESSNPNLATLVKTMLNYGACAQLQFGQYTDDLANKNISYDLVAVNPANIAVDADANIAPDLSSLNAEFEKMTAELKDGIAIRLYLKNATNFSGSVTCDGVEYPFTGSKRKMAVRENVFAYDMDTYYTFTFANGATYKTSVISFVKNTMINNSDNEVLTNLLSSMYWYNQAANTYFGK